MPLTTARVSTSRLSIGAALVGLALIVAPRDAGAVELLANGGFEGIGAAAPLPGWTLEIDGTDLTAAALEPTTWALSFGGFGMIGAMLRHSRVLALVRAR